MLKKNHWLIVNNEDDLVSGTIIRLATARGITKTICPSEVARKLWPNDWRKHMPEIREVAFALRDERRISILQRGKEVFENDIKGPIRIQAK